MSKVNQNHQMNKFYVTTPIYYINDVPHIGHAYSTIAADTLARYYRHKLGDENVLFVTGTDENSQKTINAAEIAGLTPEEYTETTAKKWQDTFAMLGISNNRFIRTTDKDHVSTVQEIMQKVYDKGDIYKGVYEGLYCVGHEAFMKEDDLVDGLCPDHKKAPEHIKEDNYFFKLSKYQDKLLEYIESHPEFIRPESRRNEIISFIKTKGLEDFSISRESQSWGIRLPFDDSQVAYVWFDALLNYVTAAGYGTDKFAKWWPADLHIVGKDIIKFHCIYWPAMLWSAGLDLPHQVFAHGFFTNNNEKISKSLGNAIDPVALVQKYGNDALRYFLLREITFGADGDFSLRRFNDVYHSDLANNLGNLVSRLATMLNKYCDGKYVQTEVVARFEIDEDIRSLAFHSALGKLFSWLDTLNGAIEENKPWELYKTDPSNTTDILYGITSELLLINSYLKPFLPDTASKISNVFSNGKVNVSAGVLFPKFENQ